jgi:hypothetical protein
MNRLEELTEARRVVGRYFDYAYHRPEGAKYTHVYHFERKGVERRRRGD